MNRMLMCVLVLCGYGFYSQAAMAHGGEEADESGGHTHEGVFDFLVAADGGQGVALKGMKNRVKIEVRGKYRYITGNGIPDHKPGQFPRRGNPHTIKEQSKAYRVPANPKVNKKPTMVDHQPFGVAINGVPFDAGTAEYWNRDRNSGWRYEALTGKLNLGTDYSNAHVQPQGAYHYHGLPVGMLKGKQGKKMVLVGYAADGFPVYSQYGYANAKDAESKLRKMKSSYQLKKGKRQAEKNGPGGKYDGSFTADFEYVKGSGDLDECNGRFGVTPEYPKGTYHYYITEMFPFIARYHRGTGDASFRRRGPRPDDGPGGRRRGGPPPRR